MKNKDNKSETNSMTMIKNSFNNLGKSIKLLKSEERKKAVEILKKELNN